MSGAGHCSLCAEGHRLCIIGNACVISCYLSHRIAIRIIRNIAENNLTGCIVRRCRRNHACRITVPVQLEHELAIRQRSTCQNLIGNNVHRRMIVIIHERYCIGSGICYHDSAVFCLISVDTDFFLYNGICLIRKIGKRIAPAIGFRKNRSRNDRIPFLQINGDGRRPYARFIIVVIPSLVNREIPQFLIDKRRI